MVRRQAVLPHMALQQVIRPEFVGVAEILRLLAGTRQHPGDRIIRNTATLARARSFTQCGVDSELKELTHTPCDGVTIHAVGNNDRIVTHAMGGLQQNGRVKHLPFLRTSRSPEILQPFPVRRRQG